MQSPWRLLLSWRCWVASLEVLQRAPGPGHGAGSGHGLLRQHLPQHCHLHSRRPGPLCAPGPCAASLGDTHEAILVGTASSAPQALGSLRDEELLLLGAILPVSCETPSCWLWGAASTSGGYKQDNPTPWLSSPCSDALGAHRSQNHRITE